MKREYLTSAKKYEAKRATESSDEEVVMTMRMMKMLAVIERCIESCFILFSFSRRVRQVRTRRKTRLIQRVAVTQTCDLSVRK